jgi:phosphoribosylformylglycinamidine synthase PurS subunit
VPRVAVDVMLKREILDPQGQAVERALPELGFEGVSGVRIGKHVELEVDGGDPEAAARCRTERSSGCPTWLASADPGCRRWAGRAA